MIKVIQGIPYLFLTALIGLYAFSLFQGFWRAAEIAIMGNPLPALVLFVFSAAAVGLVALLKEHYDEQE